MCTCWYGWTGASGRRWRALTGWPFNCAGWSRRTCAGTAGCSPVGRRLALLVATDRYADVGLRRLRSPAGDAEALAEVLRAPEIAGFEVTMLVNEPHHVVGQAIGDFYRDRRRDDLTLLYFSGHGLKDDDGQLYLAMANTRRDSLLFTALPADHIDRAMESCPSRQKVLILDCCYSGAFPAGRMAKADTEVHTLERFQGRGRTVLTASDATQYSFEGGGDQPLGDAARSVFTRYLVAGLRDGSADLDGDGDITLDELYSYVHDRVVEETPQQRPKKQDNVQGRTVIARNVNWTLPSYLRHALTSPIAADRLAALDGLIHLHRIGNPTVRAAALAELHTLANDDSRQVSTAATTWLNATVPVRLPTPNEAPTRPEPPATDDSSAADEPAADEPRLLPVMAPRTVGEVPDGKAPRAAAEGPRRRRMLIAGLVVLVLVVAGGVTFGVRAALSGSSSSSDSPGSAGSAAPAAVNDLALSPDGRRLYATDAAHHRVSIVDTATAKRVGDPLSLSGTPQALAGGGDGRRGYVITHDPDGVSAVDTATGAVTTILHGVADALALSPDGRRLYVGSTSAGTVTVLDTATNNVVGSPIAVHAVKALAVGPDGRHLYAQSDPDTSSLVVIDAATNTVATSIPVNGGASGSGNGNHSLAVSPVGHRAYVASYQGSTVCVVDTATNTAESALIRLDAGTGPTSVAVSQDGKRLFVASGIESVLWIADTTTGVVGDPISLGIVPTALAPTPDGRTVYIASRDGRVLALDLQLGRLSTLTT
jgi:YVTN family beta-propeller protein